MNTIEIKKYNNIYRNRCIAHIIHEALFRRGHEGLSVKAEFEYKKIDEIIGVSSRENNDRRYFIGNIFIYKRDFRIITYPIFTIEHNQVTAPNMIITILDNIEAEIKNSGLCSSQLKASVA